MEFTLPDHSRKRGQIGVETLIIFIAMILVAAIAATILINTAGFLQNQASETSQDSEDQVSKQVLVISSIGEITDDDGENKIGEVSMTVMQSPGADEIDLAGASIEYIGPDGQQILSYDDDPDVGEFGVDGTQDPEDTAPVLTEREDRYTVTINLADGEDALRLLDEGEDATVRINTQAGSEAVTIVNVPQSISSYDDGDAVEL